MPTTLSGIRWGLLNVTATRIRVEFTYGRGGNLTELSDDVGNLQFQCRVQEKKLKSIGHVGEELHPEGMVNRKLYLLDCNYTVSKGSNVETDIALGDRIKWNLPTGETTYARVVTLHDAAGAGIYLTANLEWDGPVGDL